MRTKKNKLLKRGRAVALAAVLFCTLIFGTMAVVPPIRAEAASINGLPINQKLLMRPIFQLDTVGRPPTILSGIPERSGRVCLTVWRPGR